MHPLKSLLASNPYLLADGAMGTMLMDAGLERGDVPEAWNSLHPDRVRAIHRGYIDAGSQIILTNTFGGNRYRLQRRGLQDRTAELNRAAAQLGCAEADVAPHKVVVAGSIGPTGEMLKPFGTLSFEDVKAAFAEQAAALAEGGVDVLWVETMSDLEELRGAVEGARSVSNLPLVATMTFDTKGRTMMGVKPVQALETIRQFNPVALGANCGKGPDELEATIQDMHAADASIVLVAKANAGLPEFVKGEIVYRATPEVMAGYAVRVFDLGARIIGGCCGNTPKHIQAMAEALRAHLA
jgi:5-methyltetrahydrofolate--homocysteine methyltransferase